MHPHLGMKHKSQRVAAHHDEQRTPYVAFLDKLTLVAGVVGPFTIVPQIWEIFTTHNASGVSLIAWILITIVTLPWVFYGFAHRDRSIVISFILWEVVNIAVVIGVLLYG